VARDSIISEDDTEMARNCKVLEDHWAPKPAAHLMPNGELNGYLLLFSLTLFLSAFLLFCIQPLIARMVLPLLGGSPAV